MKVAVTTSVGKIEIQEREKPKITSSQVLLKMLYVGICGSDIHIFHGKHPFVPTSLFPLIQGHEGVALIEEVGQDAVEFSKGDLVTIQPQIYCKECKHCRNGDYHICEKLEVLGCQCDGLFCEYFAIDKELLIKLPKTMIPEEAAFIEPLAVAVAAIRKLGNVAGKNLMVLGGGVIGNLSAQVAKAYGAHQVIIVDLYDSRLETAVTKCGIDIGINPSQVKLNFDLIREKLAGEYIDHALECVGVTNTMETAIELVPKGATIGVVGVFGDKANISMGLVQDKEITLQGTLMYKREDYVGAIDLIQQKKVELNELVYASIPLGEYPQAYQLIEENKANALKILVSVGG